MLWVSLGSPSESVVDIAMMLNLRFGLLINSLWRGCRFGAVMEEFEVRDALENLFSTKPDGGVFEDF